MRRRLLLIGVAALALAGLGASLGWVVSQASGNGSWGPGAGRGYAMMGANGRGAAWYLEGSRQVTDIAGARARAQQFADRLRLRTGEVMQFANNFYVLLKEQNGTPATEVLIDPTSGTVTLEYGPAMMWNTRYGMMGGAGTTSVGPDGMMGSGSGGMMGGGRGGMMGDGGTYGDMMGRYGGSPNWTPPQSTVNGPMTVAEAQTSANRWLADQATGMTAAQPDALPGYYTFHTLKNGKITGMLSVNEQTGAVWYHWWHGRFIAMEE